MFHHFFFLSKGFYKPVWPEHHKVMIFYFKKQKLKDTHWFNYLFIRPTVRWDNYAFQSSFLFNVHDSCTLSAQEQQSSCLLFWLHILSIRAHFKTTSSIWDYLAGLEESLSPAQPVISEHYCILCQPASNWSIFCFGFVGSVFLGAVTNISPTSKRTKVGGKFCWSSTNESDCFHWVLWAVELMTIKKLE